MGAVVGREPARASRRALGDRVKGEAMKRARRISVMAALLMVLALAVPASAASWRTYGTVRADAGNGAATSTVATAVEDVRLGIYTYGTGRRMQYDAYWGCSQGDATASRSKTGTVTTRPRTWKWVTVRASSRRMDRCDLWASAHPATATGRTKIKLQVR